MDDYSEFNWNAVEWESLIPRLLLFAGVRLKSRQLHIGSHSAEDFVFDAITKTMAGSRVWVPEKQSLLRHLLGVISSDINHYSSSIENRTRAFDSVEQLEHLPDQEHDLEQIITGRIYIDNIMHSLKDEALSTIARIMLEHGVTKSQDIAIEMNIGIQEVYNLQKRLRREVRKIVEAEENKDERREHEEGGVGSDD